MSEGPYTSLNLGDHVGDDPAAVAENRRRFAHAVGAEPVWLRQVHGACVMDAGAVVPGDVPQADGAWTDRPGVACVVLVADCLPVLLAARNGRSVGAAHAGWRGLAAGIVERTLEAVAHAAACDAHEVVAWLGPCIGPRHFEVGADVREAFARSPVDRFVPSPAREGRARWMADLAGLARDRLDAAGVRHITGVHACTVEGASDFFSYRRDSVTGRLAAAVWLRG